MKRLFGLFLACLWLSCFGLGCERHQDVEFTEALPKVPAEYGSLVAVTSVPEYPKWFQMWFEDDEGTIRIVRVQIFDNKLLPGIKMIERTHPVVKEVVEDEG